MDLAKVKSILVELGFSSWEIEAYLILIRYGPQTAVDLSRLSKVARSKTYEVVTRLRRKGLVMKVPPMPTKGMTQKFVALNPKEVFPQRINEFKQASDFLAAAYSAPQKARYPKVNFYTTKDTAKRFLLKLSKDSSSMKVFLTDPAIKRVLGFSFDLWIKEINNKNGSFIITKKFGTLAIKPKNLSIESVNNGINYIITSQRLVLDLWETQHIILDIQSKEAANTFLPFFLNK